jgi:hypothetical protein
MQTMSEEMSDGELLRKIHVDNAGQIPYETLVCYSESIDNAMAEKDKRIAELEELCSHHKKWAKIYKNTAKEALEADDEP